MKPLKKIHTINLSMMLSDNCKKYFPLVKIDKDRVVSVILYPGGATLWGSQYDEANQTNIIILKCTERT